MTLNPGTRLGPYEILSPLGAGGMGEVYRARDTRLGRDVAIKVLPKHLSANPEVRTRFEREAKTVSSLNHPHICTLFDVGREGDTDFLVMELIEGETLATKLVRGALPPAEVLKLGGEIADALDRAHRAGVVHRDLKPGNVMLTKSGAKLMDFGLARATGLAGSAGGSGVTGLTQSPTVAQPLTAEGTIVGTFQYMSPEQLEGKEADSRSDIWALGCVLYEMATGKRAYEGSTQASLISAIMRDQPRSMAELSPMSPPALERLVLQCLAKDPDDRWQSARDLARELGFVAAAPRAGAGSTSHRLGVRERIAWAAIVVLLAAVGAYFVRTRQEQPGERVISAILAPARMALATRTMPIDISPDGRMLALVCEDSTGAMSLWVRSFDEPQARRLPGTERAALPFWSPDSRDIGFFADGQVKRTSLSGGTPQVLAPAVNPGGGCWSPGGFILFSSGSTGVLSRIPEGGGEPVAVFDSLQANVASYGVRPTLLPDGRHFLFGSQANILVEGAKDGIYVASIGESEAPVLVVPDAKNAAYVDSGQLLFWKNGVLWAQPFDASRRRLSGSPSRIADDVSFNVSLGCGLFSAAASGQLVYLQGSNTELTELAWVDRAGRELEIAAPPGLYYWPRLSHDGRRIAVDLSDAVSNAGDIWIFDVTRKLGDRFTSHPLNETCPAWSPDDSRLYWLSSVDAEGTGDIHSRSLRDSGGEEATYRSKDIVRPFDVSPDGRSLLIGRRSADRQGNLDVLELSLVDGKVTPVLATEHAEVVARWSRDGRWLVYVSDESGQREIYVRRNPNSGEKWRVSTRGGTSPVWRGNGREIFYAGEDGQVMSVSFRAEPTVELGAPVFLFRADFFLEAPNCFDVSADGQRFLINRLVRARNAKAITLDQGWNSTR